MRKATLTLLALAVLAPFLALAAEPIKMMVPANPGGGWDSTGRAVLAALESEGLHKAGAQVTNKGGAGGTIGLASRWPGSPSSTTRSLSRRTRRSRR